MKVIAICGAKRSGKDTISSILCSTYNYVPIKISSELKEVCKILFGFNDCQLETDKKDEVDPVMKCKPRELMQFLGTDVMQFHIQAIVPDIGRTFWINKTIQKIQKINQPIVISDLRFVHEYEMLRQSFGTNLHIIKVKRPNLDTSGSIHCSEQEWKDIPEEHLVINDTDVNTLENLIKRYYT